MELDGLVSTSTHISNRVAMVLLTEAIRLKCLDDITKNLGTMRQLLKRRPMGDIFVFRELPSGGLAAVVRALKLLQLPEMLHRFMYFLIVKHRMGLILPNLIDEYFNLLDEYRGVTKVQIKFAGNMPQDVQKGVLRQLGLEDESRVKAKFTRDDSLLYGMQIFIGGYLLDLSARMKLSQLQHVKPW